MRVSVSSVDSYLYYRNSDKPLDEFLSELRGERPPTWQLETGKGFHEMLEHAKDGQEIDGFEADGYTFEIACDAEIALPDIRELKGTLELDVDGTPVTLVGKVDAIDGQTVIDHKMASKFDPEQYTGAFQWRAYLMMFGGNRFRYNVFVRSMKDNHITIKDFHSFDLWRYPDMERDVMGHLREFASFVRYHLPEKLEANNAA